MKNTELQNAINVLVAALNTDREYAMTWAANLAMIGIDAGGNPQRCQENAGQFLKNIGVTHPPFSIVPPPVSLK